MWLITHACASDLKIISHENVVDYLWWVMDHKIMSHENVVDNNRVDMNIKIMSHEKVVDDAMDTKANGKIK